MRFCLSGEKLNVSKEKDYIMYSLLILNFIIPFVMVLLGYLLKKYPVTDRNSGCGYNTPASRSSQEHWDYAQEIAPDIFLGLGIRLGITEVILNVCLFIFKVTAAQSLLAGIAIGVIFLLLGFYRTKTKIKNRFSEH